jgi:glyoxylase I family protein
MQLKAKGLSHLGRRVTDHERAKHFYVDILGSQLMREADGVVLINAYGVLIGLQGADEYSSKNDRFDPFRVGLDHLALTVDDVSVLENVARDLDAAGVRNHGIEEDPETHDKYISFYDPDGIAWELYTSSAHPFA